MGRGTRKFASQPVAPVLPTTPTVRGIAAEQFEVRLDLPWLRQVRIESSDYTLLYSELLLPNSPEPWPRLDAFRQDALVGIKRRHAPGSSLAPADPHVDELFTDAQALVAFHLPAFGAGRSFTPITGSPESLRTVYRYDGSDNDAYIVLRLSETGAVIFGPEPTRIHSTSRLRCDGCSIETALCWHTYLLAQALVPDSTFLGQAARAVASGQAAVQQDHTNKRVVQISSTEWPEIVLQLHLSSSRPELTIVVGRDAWPMRGRGAFYGVTPADTSLLADAVQTRLGTLGTTTHQIQPSS